MRTVFIVILSFCFFSLHAQIKASKVSSINTNTEFKNQGEQEDYLAKQFFEKNYEKQEFKKYQDTIVVKGNCFRYKAQTLVVLATPKELQVIFAKGHFYPTIISGDVQIKQESGQMFDSLSAEQKAIYNMLRTDSITIANVEELPFLSGSPTQKRFRFWFFREGFANPQVCFFELTNQSATAKTNIESFINGAVLTFYKEGWFII